MTVQRREEHTEVVSTDVFSGRPEVVSTDMFSGRSEDVNTDTLSGRPVVLGVSEPTARAAYQTKTVTGDPYSAQRSQVAKAQQVIYLLFGILQVLLGIRFILGLLGANPAAGFAQFIYGITAPFLAPFVGLFGEPRFEGSVFEWNVLVAIVVYAVLAWLLAKLVTVMLGDDRRGTYTTTSSHVDKA